MANSPSEAGTNSLIKTEAYKVNASKFKGTVLSVIILYMF